MSMTHEYQTALDALSRAADAMTRACNAYELVRASADKTQPPTADVEAQRLACDAARNAHDEALADAWELIEDQPS
jgi:hypothetical protein